MLRKKILATLAAGALALSGMVASAGSATAIGPDDFAPLPEIAKLCPGTMLTSRSITADGRLLGTLILTYDSKTGYNCAAVNYAPSTYGSRRPSSVSITTNQTRTDSGNYMYHAGPVKVPGRGMCVKASGMIQWNQIKRSVSIPWGFCG